MHFICPVYDVCVCHRCTCTLLAIKYVSYVSDRERRESAKASDSVRICFLLGELHPKGNEHPKQRVSEKSLQEVDITI